MRRTVRIIVAYCGLLVAPLVVFSQTASWSAYKPALFPTNSSGQINGISRVSQMKFHPSNSQKMYAVSARGGLFISTNAGTTWAVASGCDALTNGTRFASVCIDHTNDQILYLGGGDHNYYSNGSGVWKSTNGGGTFTQTTLTGKIVVEMIMDPANNSIIVAATNTGVYKTTDAGATWSLKTSSIAFDDMKKKENNGTRVLFASTRNAELYVSNDFGDTWTQITSGIYIPTGYTSGGGTRIGLTPADSNYVYFYMNAKGGTLFRSVNGGTSFTAVKDALSPFLTGYTNSSADPGQGDYNTGLGIDRTNKNIVYFVAHNVWKSTDGGVNWTQLTNWYEKVHTDMHQMTVSPYNTSQVWNMNDGGIWVSTDGGNNWTQKSDGIYGYEIYHGSCSPTRRDMMSIGTQDNGELYGNTTTWYTNRGGDWQSHCVFDYRANSSTVYYFLPDWGSVSLPKRRSVTGSESTYGLPSTLADIYDIAFHRSNSNLAFAGDTGIYRTTNLTAASPTWTKIYTATSAVMRIHVNYVDPNRLYIITADQKIHISSNALSATPTFTVVSLPNASSIEAHITTIKSSPNTVYITTNTKAYRSTDNGSTWTNITYNLPATNHTGLISDEYFSSNELVFLSTGGTVYYKTSTAASWSIFNTNLPSRTTIVDMSIFNDSTSNTVLRVFTYGRGVWETPVNSLRSMTANFAADNTAPCVGAFVNFSDLSTGNVTSRNWSFPGGNPSSSTSPNPLVNYSTSGTFTVSLTVSDGTTSTSITRADYINTQGKSLPVAESYESGVFPPPNWTNVDASLDSKAWSQYSGAGGFGSSANCMYYDNFSVDAGGAYDEFRSIAVDLKAFTAASLKFDVAYQPYSLTSYIDSFQVLLSTNCGNTFTSLYLKYGSGLNTTGTTSTTEFVPAAGQWRQETISLNQFLNNSVVIAFRNIGHFGNNLYIDNILIEGTPVVLSAGPDKTICSGSSAGIGSSPVSGMIYSWFPTTGLSSGTSSNPVASPATTTTYVLTGTVSSSGYTTRDTVVVTVNTAPTITFNPPASLCKNGAPTLLSATPSGGTFAGTGVTGNQFDPSVGPGTFTVTYTVTATNGCVSTSTKNIQVNTVSLTAAVTAVSCNGQSNGAIDLTPTAGSGNYSYAWSNGATTQDLTAITAGTYDVTLTDVTTGCTATGTYSVTQPAAIVLSNIAPASASSGTTVVITGSGFTGVTDVKVNNVSVGPSNYIVNSSTQISMTVTPSMTSGPVTVVCGSCSGSSATSFIKTGINLTVRVLIQGYYSGSSAMRPVLLNQGVSGATTSMSDTVEVRLYGNTAPPVLVESKKVVLSQFGTGTTSMPTTPAGTYWIAVVHRNSIETWSSNPVALNTSTVTYNFTSSASMAYGNNMVLLSTGQWGIYSGNLPAQDNAIDVNDLQQLEQAIQNGIIFGYNYHDLTGDGIVESADFSLLENNQGVQVIKP